MSGRLGSLDLEGICDVQRKLCQMMWGDEDVF